MVFNLAVTTPANTPITDPLYSSIVMFPGLIYHMGIYIPTGPEGLLGVQLSAGGIQIAPFNRNSWLIGDDIYRSYDDLQYFTVSTAQLDVITYNLDATLDHECFIDIGIAVDEQFQEAIAPKKGITDLVDAINNLVAQLQSSKTTGTAPSTPFIASLTGGSSNG